MNPIRFVISVMSLCLVLAFPVPASAEDLPPGCSTWQLTEACLGPGDGGIGVGVGKVGGHHGGGVGGGDGQPYQYEFVLTCPTNGPDGPNDPCGPASTICGQRGLLNYWLFRRPIDGAGNPTGPWQQMPGTYCRGANPNITPSDIAAAFRWRFVPIAPSRTHVNPSNGTLVNVDTIFYADTAGSMHTTITLLGERVQLKLHPIQWFWRFGDGTSLTTTTPGAPYPNTSVTHRYAKPGSYAASVTVTWDGTFTFGGQTTDIPGNTSAAGPPANVTVREAHSHLVDG